MMNPTTERRAHALKLDVSRTEDIAVGIVFGREPDELRRVILDLLNKNQRIVLNLAWIEYIDSSGLGVLVASLISGHHHEAQIKLAALGPKARHVLSIARVDRLFEVYDSADEAIKSFHPHHEFAAG